MPRVLWKGAISFGLVHIPVGLYPASREDSIDFDWLDKRSMDPVGYKRVNKKTGKEIDRENIVKGIKQDDGQYVLMTDDEIKSALPKSTQTIEIEAFVDSDRIPFVYLEKPYYLEPIGKAEKVYVLLRETLREAGKIGIARVVISTKQHLAALIPAGPALMLNTLRWSSEIRPWNELTLPDEGSKGAKLSAGELKMARQLVDDMSGDWKPDEYADTFKQAVMALVDAKIEAGDTKTVHPVERPDEGAAPSNVVDLTDLLKRSLKGSAGKADKAAKAGRKTAANDEAEEERPAASGGRKPPAKRRAG